MSYVSAPAANAVAVTPSDATVLAPTRGLYIGGAGSLVVTMYGSGNIVTFAAVPVGVIPIQVTKVMAATAATNIVALW